MFTFDLCTCALVRAGEREERESEAAGLKARCEESKAGLKLNHFLVAAVDIV